MVISRTREEKFTYMTETPVNCLVCRMAVPTVMSMLVTSLYNVADTFFVSLLNNTSITGAIGVIFPVMTVIQALGFMLGQGSGNHVSRALGAKDYDMARKISATGFFNAIALGILLLVLGISSLRPLVMFLGATDTICRYAMQYGGIILAGAPWMMAAMVLNTQLRLQGSAQFSMIGLVSGAAINMVLDPILILGLKMGIVGAALATISSQFISFLILLWGIHRDGNVVPEIKSYSFEFDIHKKIVTCGFPALIRQSLAGVSMVCLNNAARSYGDAIIAAVSIVNRIMNFAYSVALGMGQSFQPVCGFNYSAKLYDRVLKAYFFTLKMIFATLLIASIIGFLFPMHIVNCFSNDTTVIQFGGRLLRMQCTVFYLQSFTVVSNMMMQNVGKILKATILSAARQGLFFIPAVFMLTYLLGKNGLLYVQTVSDISSFLIAFPLTIPVLKELKSKAGMSAFEKTESLY